jgi:hypothetical protein
VLVGVDEAEVERRVRDQVAMFGAREADSAAWIAERRSRWIAGTPDAARAMAARFAAAGVERLMLQVFLPRDHAMIELAARELMGRV